MEEVKDMYNPTSDMDILGTLNKKPRKTKKLKLDSGSGISLRSKMVMVFIWGSVCILATTVLGLKAVKGIGDFFDDNTFAYHRVIEVKTSWPVTIEKRTPAVEYVKVTVAANNVASTNPLNYEDKQKLVNSTNFPYLVNGFWIKETSKGKGKNANDPTNHQSNCERSGLTNEFGYGPAQNICFGTFEESVKAIDKFIGENLKNMTMDQFICFYRYGKPEGKLQNTCDYSLDFHKIMDKDVGIALK